MPFSTLLYHRVFAAFAYVLAVVHAVAIMFAAVFIDVAAALATATHVCSCPCICGKCMF